MPVSASSFLPPLPAFTQQPQNFFSLYSASHVSSSLLLPWATYLYAKFVESSRVYSTTLSLIFPIISREFNTERESFHFIQSLHSFHLTFIFAPLSLCLSVCLYVSPSVCLSLSLFFRLFVSQGLSSIFTDERVTITLERRLLGLLGGVSRESDKVI